MTRDTRRRVLVSEPQAITGELQQDNAKPYLPYVWALLKSYHERHSSAAGDVSWLDPIWQPGPPSELLEPYDGIQIDVLGLSCYTWNWELQCAIAARVKARNPECLVVAGGPEPDYNNPSFFADHPDIDVVVVKDGEIPFSRILEHVVTGTQDLTEIRGLCLPARDGDGDCLYTGSAVVPMQFDHSPYVDQDNYYQRLTAGLEPGHFNAILETNRGCPYGCSYCDWGSSTNSKIRRFDVERVEAELEWLASMKLDSLMIADANFGILPRDVEIAERLSEIRARYGNFPRSVYWNTAKNNPDRVIAIARTFAESGACPTFQLSIQHTNDDVLAATDRSNISTEKQLRVVKALMEVGTPIEVQLIVGIPGDTYDKWRGCFADLMEWGIHEDYLVQLYQLLPNAPASAPTFLSRWQVKTVGRILYDRLVRDVNAAQAGIPQKPGQVIVETSSYSQDDWVQMSVYSAMVKALHNAGVTQRIAMYLRLTHNVGYRHFYDDLIDNCQHQLETLRTLRTLRFAVEKHYRDFLAHDDGSDHMQFDEFPELPWAVHPSLWVFVNACVNADSFYEELRVHLLDAYPEVRNLDSVIGYQRDVLILPSYDRDLGKVIRTDLDWPGYFERAVGREGSDSLPEPTPTPGASLVACDRAVGELVKSASSTQPGQSYFHVELDWRDGEKDPWVSWIENLVIGPTRSSAKMHTLSDLRVAP